VSRGAEVEHAIKLSRETYCSVPASLRPNTDVEITCSLADKSWNGIRSREWARGGRKKNGGGRHKSGG